MAVPDARPPAEGLPQPSSGDDWEIWTAGEGDANHSLVDLVNRVLDRGVVITGDITLSVAGVDLVYLGLNAVLTSISTARRSLGRGGVRIPDPTAPPADAEGRA